TVIQTGAYTVTVTLNSCTASDAINIGYVSPQQISLGNDTTLCEGNVVSLNAFVPTATYTWQNGSTQSTFNVTQTGTYSITVTAGGCSASDTIDVLFNAYPVADLGNDFSICPGNIATLDATVNNATYVWQDGSTANTLTVSQSGTYWVNVELNNCVAS